MSKRNDWKKIAGYILENQDSLRKQGIQLHKDHPIPMSRRELFAAGLLATGYSMVMPSIGNILLASTGDGADMQCNFDKTVLGVPVLQIHFSGGRRLWGDGVALGLREHGKPEEFIPASGVYNFADYFNYGLSPDRHPGKSAQNAYVQFGNHPMQPISYIYQSARDALVGRFAAIDSKLSILSFAASQPDDSADTLQSILPSVVQLRGKTDFQLVSNSAGTELHGLGAKPLFSVSERTNVVNNKDISQLMNTGLGDVSADVKKTYLNTIHEFIKNRISSADSHKILGCSNKAAQLKVLDYAQAMDPFVLDPKIAEIFNATISREVNVGTICYMLSRNLSLAAGLTFGGFDYHNQTSNGYERDYDHFKNIVWKIIRYFDAIGKPIILFLTSDGATYCGDAIDPRQIMINGALTEVDLCASTGDRGQNGGSLMMMLSGNNAEGNPISRLPLAFQQVGYGLAKGAVARDGNPIGYDQPNYAAVVVETVRKAMLGLGGSGSTLAKNFQEATGGARFPDELRKYIAIS